MLRTPVVCSAFMLVATVCMAQQSKPIEIRIDLTDAPRHLVHVQEILPAHAGINTYSYPEWIPGQELKGGPIDNLAGLVFHAESVTGKVLTWRRDLSDPFAFHVTAPEGVTSVAVSFDVLEVPSKVNTIGTNRTSSHVVMLETSDSILYPSGTPPHDLSITPSLHLPSGWRAASALRTEGSDVSVLNGPDTIYKTVSLEQYVDSPILAGDHCRQYPLAREIHPAHTLDVCADKATDLDLQPAFLAHMSDLVRQAEKLFLSHHYEHYDFLVADSSHIGGDSEEHTQSADYAVESLDTTIDRTARSVAYLFPHEYVHSWCGKYRRPAGIATSSYQTPMQNDLIWVYEGLTEYYGYVLAARAGFLSPAHTVVAFDQSVYQVDQPGRVWRSVQDSADASAILRGNDPAWSSWRMSQDYYPAGALLWLEADVKIRQLTHGKRSLDDFSARFFGLNEPGAAVKDTSPGVLPYRFEDVLKALNDTTPYDWSEFWVTRLNSLDRKPPVAGLEAAGYNYIEADTMIPEEAVAIKAAHLAELLHSIGVLVMADGTLRDVWVGSPAYKAGLGPGDKLTMVDGKPYSAGVLTAAVKAAKSTTAPIQLTAERDDEPITVSVDYHGGEHYAALARNGNPDLLTTAILQPR